MLDKIKSIPYAGLCRTLNTPTCVCFPNKFTRECYFHGAPWGAGVLWLRSGKVEDDAQVSIQHGGSVPGFNPPSPQPESRHLAQHQQAKSLPSCCVRLGHRKINVASLGSSKVIFQIRISKHFSR